MAKVSVVIPCYNQGQYVDEAVDSMLNQTFQDVEILIVNDGSTDPCTRQKLQQYVRPKTRVIHTENQGLPNARNSGIAQAQGKYILPLDADDYFEKTFLEKAVQILDTRTEIGVVTCGMQCFDMSTKRHMPKGGGAENFVIGNNACVASLFRKTCREEVGGYDGTMTKGYEDWDFWIDITKRGWIVHVIPEYLFFYRRRPGSMVRESDAIKPELIKHLVKNHRQLFEEHVAEILAEKERKILLLKRQKNELRHSLSYRIGQTLTTPYRLFRQRKKT